LPHPVGLNLDGLNH